MRHGPACPAKEDVGYRSLVVIIGGVVHIQRDLPGSARLHPVQVTDGHDYLQAGQVEAVGVAFADVPGQRAKALAEAGGTARAPANAAAGADRLAVAGLEVGSPDTPIRHNTGSQRCHHFPLLRITGFSPDSITEIPHL